MGTTPYWQYLLLVRSWSPIGHHQGRISLEIMHWPNKKLCTFRCRALDQRSRSACHHQPRSATRRQSRKPDLSGTFLWWTPPHTYSRWIWNL